MALFAGLLLASACKKESAVQPSTVKAAHTLMGGPADSTGVGGSGGEDRPKPTTGS